MSVSKHTETRPTAKNFVKSWVGPHYFIKIFVVVYIALFMCVYGLNFASQMVRDEVTIFSAAEVFFAVLFRCCGANLQKTATRCSQTICSYPLLWSVAEARMRIRKSYFRGFLRGSLACVYIPLRHSA